MKIDFEWDLSKASSNLRKHGISFDVAKDVFSDPNALTYRDDFHSNEEDRWITIGAVPDQRILLVVHTEADTISGNVIIRIISCRKATRSERETYEKS